MTGKGKLPNFFILGAPKCGTTAVAKILSEHADVYVPPEKEVRFFSDDALYEQGVSYLVDRFAVSSDVRIRCDASPQYIYNDKVISRMLQVYGDAFAQLKFMVMLRDPVDRAYSAYWMAVRYGWESRSFDDAIAQCLECADAQKYQADGQFNIHSYVEAGMYAKQIQVWLDKVAKQQIMFYSQESMRDDPLTFYKTLSKHLGVDLTDGIDMTKKVNQASMPRSRALMRLTDESSIIKNIFKPFIPQDLRYKLRRAISDKNLKAQQYEPMSEASRERLRLVYKEDIEQLRTMVGGDLTLWENTNVE